MAHFGLNGGKTSIIFDCQIGAHPRIVYRGASVPESTSTDQFLKLELRQESIGNANVSIGVSMTMEAGWGWLLVRSVSRYAEGFATGL